MIKPLAGLVVCLLLTLQSLAQVSKDRIDSLFNDHYLSARFSGKVLIAQKGKIVFENNYGLADYLTKTEFEDSTRFQVASVSKQFTAAGILKLQEAGKLRVEDPVKKFLPDFPYASIKITHLLSHTSGLPNFVKTMWPLLDTTKSNGNREMYVLLVNQGFPLQWAPGSKWEYSDIGYDLLAMIIEKVAATDFTTFMRDNLFAPAGMRHTEALLVTDIRRIRLPGMAMGHWYDYDDSRYTHAHLQPANNFIFWLGDFYGDGSVVSTPKDLLRWMQALTAGEILSPTSVQKAFQPSLLPNGKPVQTSAGNQYGYGWEIINHPSVGKVIGHGGLHPGYQSKVMYIPATDMIIVILSNTQSSAFWKFSGEELLHVLGNR